MELVYNVYYRSFNNNEIVKLNIFNHIDFYKAVLDNIKKYKNKEEFAEAVRKDLLYCFWGKCEYEVIITSWPAYITPDELNKINKSKEEFIKTHNKEKHRYLINPDVGIKIDIYEQVMMNFNIFIDYIWNNKKNINKRS